MVYVTNKGTKDFIGEYAYKKYEFPVGKSIEISEDVAQFLFGYGVDDKYVMLVRNGWLKMSNEYNSAMKELSNFTFSTTQPEKNHSSPVIERVTPMPPKGGRGVKAHRAA